MSDPISLTSQSISKPNPNFKHGHSPKSGGSPTYRSWRSMLNRCNNPKHKNYINYGGRGIAVCERWKLFENFLEDVGERPEGTSLDRINNDGNYEPVNCRWSDAIEQHSNTRRNVIFTINGITGTMAELCRRFQICKHQVWSRINKFNWPPEKAFLAQIRPKKPNSA
jgi:hypothetical protein